MTSRSLPLALKRTQSSAVNRGIAVTSCQINARRRRHCHFAARTARRPFFLCRARRIDATSRSVKVDATSCVLSRRARAEQDSLRNDAMQRSGCTRREVWNSAEIRVQLVPSDLQEMCFPAGRAVNRASESDETELKDLVPKCTPVQGRLQTTSTCPPTVAFKFTTAPLQGRAADVHNWSS